MKQLDNMGVLTPAARQRVESEWLARREKYGADPGTKAQAAAHEAGHAILTAVLGWRFDGARISRKGKVWIGASFYTHRLTGETFHAANEPEMLFAMVIHTLAGQIGEVHAGLWHPTSSVDEAASATAMCAHLDVIYGLPTGATLARAADFARDQIELHWPTFSLLRTHLMRTCRVWPIEGRRMLAAVVRTDPKAPYSLKEKPAC